MAIDNKILLHHLKEHFGTSIPIDLLPFVDKLNDVYNETALLPQIADNTLVKVKNKTKKADDCDKMRIHKALIEKIARTGSWEFDYPLHNIAGYNNTGSSHVYYFSDEVYRILGLEPGSPDINKDLFFPQLNPYDLSEILESSTALDQESKRYHEEHVLMMNDGTEKVVLKHSDIFFDKENGTPTKIVGTLQDVTEKRKLENDLQTIRRKKDSILQNLFNAYLSYDVINNKVLFSNHAFQKVFENTPLQNKTSEASFLSLISDEDKTGAYSLLRKLAKGQIASYNFRIRLNDGGYRWLESKLVPTQSLDGQLIQIELIANDVTACRLADKQMAEVKSDFQKQLFNVGEVVMVLNDNLLLTYLSENVSRLIGYMPDELTGTPLLQIVHAGDVAEVTAYYTNTIQGSKETNRLSFRLLHKAGHEVWCECMVHNMAGNALTGNIITRVRDITFFKEHEERLINTVDELKQANTNLENFVSVVSHDLRAPLSSMEGILDIINLKESSANFSEELAYLRSSISNLDSFIIDLLNYSKCTKSEIRSESICLEQLLDETTNYLKFMNANNTPVTFRKDVKNGVLFYSDPKMINIILNNLISNAIRYSNPNGSPYVEVKINATDKDAQIEVTDNGIGIAMENQDKVFDMFYRVTDDNNGTGMGLHLVKLAVEKLSGNIRLESEHNVGTKFLITIPNMLHNQN